MLRERIALRGSPLGLPPRSHGEALTGPRAPDPGGSPRRGPLGPGGGGAPRIRNPVAPVRGDRPPLETGRWGAVRGHVVPTSGACLLRPVLIAHSGRRPRRDDGPLAASERHLLTCYSPVCHGRRQPRAFGPPRSDPGGSAPAGGPTLARAAPGAHRPPAPDGGRPRRTRRHPAREGGRARGVSGGRRPPRRRHRVLPVGVDGPESGPPSPRAGRGDSPGRSEAVPVLTWCQPSDLHVLVSFTSLSAAQRLNASRRDMMGPRPPRGAGAPRVP